MNQPKLSHLAETLIGSEIVKLGNAIDKKDTAAVNKLAASALQIATKNHWPDLQVVVHMMLGGMHLSDQKPNDALVAYRQAEHIALQAQQNGHPAGRKLVVQTHFALNVIRLELPPLREIRADKPLLIDHILRRLSSARKAQASRISEEAMEILLNYDYPGNVRELENILEHALIICQEEVIGVKHLPIFHAESHARCRSGERRFSTGGYPHWKKSVSLNRSRDTTGNATTPPGSFTWTARHSGAK